MEVRLDAFLPVDSVAERNLSTDADKIRDHVAAMYEAYREDLFRYVRSRGLGSADAREVCQEVFLRLYTALSRGEEIKNPRAWAFTVAHNIGVNELRAVGHTEGWNPDSHEAIAGATSDPEESLLEGERMLRLHRAVGALPPHQRRCLQLRAAGFRYREIAEITGVTLSTVGESLRRAVRRLREAIYE